MARLKWAVWLLLTSFSAALPGASHPQGWVLESRTGRVDAAGPLAGSIHQFLHVLVPWGHIAYYRFDTDDIGFDSSPYQNNLTACGGASSAMLDNGALSLDGLSGFLAMPGACPSSSQIVPRGIPVNDSSYSIVLSFLPIDPQFGGRPGGMIGWGSFCCPPAGHYESNAVRLGNPPNTFTLFYNYWFGEDATVDLTLSPVPILNDDNWHTMGISFDNQTRQHYIVLDGYIVFNKTRVTVPNVYATNFRIGNTNTDEFFRGHLDDIIIWGRALTLAELGFFMTPTASVTPTATPSVSPTSSLTPTSSMTPSVTPTSSPSPSPSLTPTRSVTPTPTPTRSVTPTSSVTQTPSLTPSVTPTPSLTPSVTPTMTQTPSLTPSVTPTSTKTPTPTSTSTESMTGTSTPSATASVTPSLSWTPSPSFGASTSPSPSRTCGPLPTDMLLRPENNDTGVGVGATRAVQCSVDTWGITATLYCTPLGWSSVPSCLSPLHCDGGGLYVAGDSCGPCPTGSFCPGGTWVWPLPGYWSHGSGEVPLLCRTPLACPGYQPASINLTSFNVQTQLCSTGYVGEYCATCAPGFYEAFDTCLPCPPNAGASLAALAVAAFVLFATMAAGVVVLPVQKLSVFVTVLILFQQLTLVGRIAASRIADTHPDLARALTYLAIFSFDVEFATPACSNGAIGFITLFWATLAMSGIVAVMFVAAAAIRACVVAMRATRGKPPPNTGKREEWKAIGGVDLSVARPSFKDKFTEVFRRRAARALLILATIFYFQYCTRIFQGLTCDRSSSGKLLLRAQLSVVCYEGAHAAAVSVMFVLLVFFVAAYPPLAFWKLRALYKRGTLEEPRTFKRWGSLYSGAAVTFYWFKLLSFPVTVILCAVNASVTDVSARLLAPGVVFCVRFALTSILGPYKKRRLNLVNGLIDYGKTLFPLILLGIKGDRGMFIALLVLTIVATLLAVVAMILHLTKPTCLSFCCRSDGKIPGHSASPRKRFDSDASVSSLSYGTPMRSPTHATINHEGFIEIRADRWAESPPTSTGVPSPGTQESPAKPDAAADPLSQSLDRSLGSSSVLDPSTPLVRPQPAPRLDRTTPVARSSLASGSPLAPITPFIRRQGSGALVERPLRSEYSPPRRSSAAPVMRTAPAFRNPNSGSSFGTDSLEDVALVPDYDNQDAGRREEEYPVVPRYADYDYGYGAGDEMGFTGSSAAWNPSYPSCPSYPSRGADMDDLPLPPPPFSLPPPPPLLSAPYSSSLLPPPPPPMLFPPEDYEYAPPAGTQISLLLAPRPDGPDVHETITM